MLYRFFAEVYEDSRAQLEVKLKNLSNRNTQDGEEMWEVKKNVSEKGSSLMTVTEARRYLAELSPEEQSSVRLRQMTRGGEAMSTLWLPGNMMEWQ